MRSLDQYVAPPTLTQHNQWGQRIDKLVTSEGWRALKGLAQKEGIPAIFYEREFGEHSRTYGFAKMLLMVGDSHNVNSLSLDYTEADSWDQVFCPLAMTDGCARGR
jgi:hypothetical protein